MSQSNQSSIIYQILSKKSIVDYLETKGCHPYRILGAGKIQYLCPFPDHEETKPSFMVWTGAEYENFYCFGCQRNYNIIHLVAEMEGVSFKKAVEKLGDGIESNLRDSVDIEIERSLKSIPPILTNELNNVEGALMSISSLCFSYLFSVDNDPGECEIIDKLLNQVDQDLLNLKFDDINETSSQLGNILVIRRQQFESNKTQEARDQLKRSYQCGNQ